MASAQELQKFVTRQKLLMRDSGNIVAEGVPEWFDLSLYGRFFVAVMASSLTGAGVTIFEIEASADSAGSGTNATIKVHALGDAPDAVEDMVILEVSAEEVQGESTETTGPLRYVGANLKAANAADRATIVYIFSDPTFPRAGLTADVVA